MSHVLVVDGEDGMHVECSAFLKLMGHVISQAGDAEEAIALAEATEADVSLVDIFMPGLSGMRAAEILTHLERNSRIVFVSADPVLLRKAPEMLGIGVATCPKPIDSQGSTTLIDGLSRT